MSDKHDKAVELTEQAIDALEEGRDDIAQELIGEAKKLDPTAPAEVVDELDKDASK
jgi:phage shock protein A